MEMTRNLGIWKRLLSAVPGSACQGQQW